MELTGSRYYFSLLNDNDKKAYNEIYKAISLRKSSVSPKGFKLDSRNFSQIIIAVNYDNPQFYYVNFHECRIVSSLFGSSLVIAYYYDSSRIFELNREISSIVQNILKSEINEHQSDYDKVLRLHDKLKFMAKYDMEAFKMVTLKGKMIREAHTIVGMFIKHKCVCEGYAKSMQLLCTMAGVESILVNGTAQSAVGIGPHSWNIVKINGYYHHVDVTWDSQYADDMTVSCYGYLNLSDKTIEKDHTWERNKYPKCNDEPYNYFKMNSAIIGSKAELERFLYENIMNEEDNISFRIKENPSIQNLDVDMMRSCISNASSKCKYLLIDSFDMVCMETQNVYALRMIYKSC